MLCSVTLVRGMVLLLRRLVCVEQCGSANVHVPVLFLSKTLAALELFGTLCGRRHLISRAYNVGQAQFLAVVQQHGRGLGSFAGGFTLCCRLSGFPRCCRLGGLALCGLALCGGLCGGLCGSRSGLSICSRSGLSTSLDRADYLVLHFLCLLVLIAHAGARFSDYLLVKGERIGKNIRQLLLLLGGKSFQGFQLCPECCKAGSFTGSKSDE